MATDVEPSSIYWFPVKSSQKETQEVLLKKEFYLRDIEGIVFFYFLTLKFCALVSINVVLNFQL